MRIIFAVAEDVNFANGLKPEYIEELRKKGRLTTARPVIITPQGKNLGIERRNYLHEREKEIEEIHMGHRKYGGKDRPVPLKGVWKEAKVTQAARDFLKDVHEKRREEPYATLGYGTSNLINKDTVRIFYPHRRQKSDERRMGPKERRGTGK